MKNFITSIIKIENGTKSTKSTNSTNATNFE